MNGFSVETVQIFYRFQRAFETNNIQYTYDKQKNKMGNNASTVGIDDSSAIAAPTTNGSEKEYLGMY